MRSRALRIIPPRSAAAAQAGPQEDGTRAADDLTALLYRLGQMTVPDSRRYSVLVIGATKPSVRPYGHAYDLWKCGQLRVWVPSVGAGPWATQRCRSSSRQRAAAGGDQFWRRQGHRCHDRTPGWSEVRLRTRRSPTGRRLPWPHDRAHPVGRSVGDHPLLRPASCRSQCSHRGARPISA